MCGCPWPWSNLDSHRYSLKHLSCVWFKIPHEKTTLPGKSTHNLDCLVYIYPTFSLLINDLCHVDENVGVLIFSSIKLNAGPICSMNTDLKCSKIIYFTRFIFMLYDADHDSIILAYIQFHTYLLVLLQDKRTQ